MQPTDTTNNTSSLADNTTDNSSLAAAPSKKLSKPSSRVRRRLKDAAPLPFKIDGLSHDGRGVAIYGNGFGTDEGHIEEKHGKKVFVSFALPNESVNVRLTNSRKSFEEGDAVELLDNAHPERQTPPCPHFGVCGGCSLQHWQPDGQIAFKQTVLAELLQHQADVQPDNWLPPVVADRLG